MLTMTVIIPTMDRFNDIQKCIDSILQQSIKPALLIVVDASGESGLEEIISQKLNGSGINFTYLKSESGLTRQRNLGLQKNVNDLVLFLDDDVILDSDYVKEMISFFNADNVKRVGGATGKIINLSAQGVTSKIVRKLFCLSEYSRGEIKRSMSNNPIAPEVKESIRVQWLSGCSVFRSEVFSRYLYDEKLTKYCYLEDVEFSVRISEKYVLYFNPEAKYVHNYRTSPGSRLKIQQKRKMFMINYYYLFRKNRKPTMLNSICHYWSYIGLILLGIFFQRSPGFVLGTIEGMFINLTGRNSLANQLKST